MAVQLTFWGASHLKGIHAFGGCFSSRWSHRELLPFNQEEGA